VRGTSSFPKLGEISSPLLRALRVMTDVPLQALVAGRHTA
jgi:hypothetical protein